jgi:dUTP pyrophosphatase
MRPEDLKDMSGFKQYAEKIQSMINEDDDEIDFDAIYNEYGIDVMQLDKEMRNYTPKLDLGFVKLNSDAVEPSYNYESDSGFDLYSTEEIVVNGMGRALIPTGLSFDIKDGYEIQVRSKSGLAINQGLFVLNSPGTVDSGYLGEIKVIIFNTNPEPFTIKKGMKVAQAVLSPVVNGKWVNLVHQKEIKSKDRNANGFGSTNIF